MALTVSPLSYRSVTIVDPITGNQATVVAGALQTSGGGGGGTVTIAAGSAIIGKVGIDQTTPGTTNGVVVNAALPAGANIIGKVSIDQTTDGTTNAVHLVAGTALAGKFGIDQTTPGTTNAVTIVPATSGGLSRTRTIIPNNTTNIVIKGSAGQLYALWGSSNSTTIAYVKVYDAASATAGSGTPVDTLQIPSPAAGGGGGFMFNVPSGIAHATGITLIITTGIADNDTAAPAASTYVVTAYFK